MDCIAARETPNGEQVGRAGERGRFQMTRAARADNRDPVRHLAWLIENLNDPTPYRLALAWNAGLHAVQTGHTTPRQRTYAQDVANLYFDPTFP